MLLYYDFEDNGFDDYEYEVDWLDVKQAIMTIIGRMTKEEIFEKMENCAEDSIDIEEQFRDELWDFFEHDAHNQYYEDKMCAGDLEFDYYKDKL